MRPEVPIRKFGSGDPTVARQRTDPGGVGVRALPAAGPPNCRRPHRRPLYRPDPRGAARAKTQIGEEYDAHVEADAAVVARVAEGDAEALRDLYERYGRIVYGLSYRLTRDTQLAEEATQDTFVTLWKRAGAYDPRRAKVTTWLFVIARNRAIELVRARMRVPEPHDEVEPGGEDADPADLAQVADEAERIASAIAELPESQLEVIRLAYFDGLSHSEIAERLDQPLGTVKSRIRLGLDRLRALLELPHLEVER
jgi:RNA polymerase sigma-70 factor (ECF subfamily)